MNVDTTLGVTLCEGKKLLLILNVNKIKYIDKYNHILINTSNKNYLKPQRSEVQILVLNHIQ